MAATSPAGMAIRWSGSALRRARPRLRSPSPASATTMAAPARQQAYTATVRSIPGRIEEGDPLAGADPGPVEPDGQVGDPLLQVGEADRRGGVRPSSAMAVAGSSARSGRAARPTAGALGRSAVAVARRCPVD